MGNELGSALAVVAVLWALRGSRSAPRPPQRAGLVPAVHTGEATPRIWIQTRDQLARQVLTETGQIPLEAINAAALALLVHWAWETGLGRREDNGNMGNIRYFPGQFPRWYMRGRLPYRAYLSALDGARDYVRLLSQSPRYRTLWGLLQAGQDPASFIREIRRSGYGEYAGQTDQQLSDQASRLAETLTRELQERPDAVATGTGTGVGT